MPDLTAKNSNRDLLAFEGTDFALLRLMSDELPGPAELIRISRNLGKANPEVSAILEKLSYLRVLVENQVDAIVPDDETALAA